MALSSATGLTLANSNEHSVPLFVIISAVALVTAVVNFVLAFWLQNLASALGLLGWLVLLFVQMFVIERIDRNKHYGGAIRLGMAIGLGLAASAILVSW